MTIHYQRIWQKISYLDVQKRKGHLKPTRNLNKTERTHIQVFSIKILIHSSLSNRRVRANAHISRIKLKFKLLSISLVPKGNSTSISASTSFPWTILVGQQYASTTLGKRFVFWQGFHLCSFICICYHLLFDDIGNWWVKKSKRKGGINFYLLSKHANKNLLRHNIQRLPSKEKNIYTETCTKRKGSSVRETPA